MTLTFLWTDIMVWLLVVALIAWGWVISRSGQVKKQWHTIFKSGIAMASAIVLLFYLLFTLLDSVHLRFVADVTESKQGLQYQGEMVSLLDLMFTHNIENSERTYSAPFATHEYAKSIVLDKKGVSQQVNLPLKHVSVNNHFWKDSLFALLVGAGLAFLLIALHLFWRKQTAKESVLPWKIAYLTLALLIMAFTWLYLLSFSYHVLGTDKVGGDVLYQSLKSIRTGVLIGILTTLIMLPVAIILGVSAGLLGGWVDDVIQYLYTTLSSIPGVLLIAAGVLSMQILMDNNPQWFESTLERSDIRLVFLIVILGITSWTGLCRLLRAETLKISQVEFVTAAKAFGVGKWTIIRRHIIPNLMHIILISIVLDFSGLVLAEAVLSYVGVGVDPTMFSWGNMINQARLEMAREPMVWWSLFSAFIFMFILVLAANLFSDRIQRVLDPRNKT
ncbi:MAG: ABC transporter permease subunit [Sulfurovum sp.]|nr:ABC transporter permease subunit [Sulfurovum sp.]